MEKYHEIKFNCFQFRYKNISVEGLCLSYIYQVVGVNNFHKVFGNRQCGVLIELILIYIFRNMYLTI